MGLAACFRIEATNVIRSENVSPSSYFDYKEKLLQKSVVDMGVENSGQSLATAPS